MPAERILTILELLQTHGRLGGAEIAARAGVDRRTVRRDIARLEQIGVPVTTSRGPHGGYELVAGFKLPPLMFTNEEAVAIALGLAAVRGLGLTDSAHAVSGAESKLERVMPANLREKVRSIGETVAFAPVHRASAASSDSLAVISAAAHSRRSVRLAYRSRAGESSSRVIDPYGIAFRNGRWYVAGFCHLRGAPRTFRLDRVTEAEALSGTFARPEGFELAAHLSAAIALLPRQHAVEVYLEASIAEARAEIVTAIGVLEAAGAGTVLHSQVDDLDWFARELARLPWPFHVVKPDGLRAAVTSHARSLLKATKNSCQNRTHSVIL